MKAQWRSLVVAMLTALVLGRSGQAQDMIPNAGLPSGGNSRSYSLAYAMPPAPQVSTLPPLAPVPARGTPYAQTDLLAPAGYSSNQPEAPCDQCMPTHFTPYMLGDFVGPLANSFSSVKIAKGESPRPIDRVFYKFNYYNNVDKSRWKDPTEPVHNVSLYQHVFGFEKTFFDQLVSIGLRIPFYTVNAEAKDFYLAPDPNSGDLVSTPGGPGIDSTHFGNISVIAKTVLWEDRQTGSLVSSGAILSFPTASSRFIDPGQSTGAYIQPYGGFIYCEGNLFVQGFTSITFPLVHAESIVMFNDLGVGFYVFRESPEWSLLTGIAPTVEIHVASPLRQADPDVNNSGLFDDLKLHNVVNFTLGVTWEFGNQATLGTGVVLPVTGPKPFDVEALGQLNYRF